MNFLLQTSTINGLYSWFGLLLLAFIPLTIVSIGAMFTERGGVVNIGLEGMMVFGAFWGVGFLHIAQSIPFFHTHALAAYLIGAGIAVVTGILISVLHAFTSINLGSNQIISATAINIFAPAFAMFTTGSLSSNGQRVIEVANQLYIIKDLPGLGDVNVIGRLFFQNFSLSTFIGIFILLITFFILYKTRFGLRLRACGENPAAADVAGVNVYKYRWIGVLLSGALAGLGGYFLITNLYLEFKGDVSGYGFLALAIMIFGGWKPLTIILSSLFFSVITSVSAGHAFFPFLNNIKIPDDVYNMIPYLLTIIVLVLFSWKNLAPKADGIPYIKNKSK